LIIPLYLLYVISILFFLLIKSGLKLEIIKELASRLTYITKNIKGIWSFRKETQKKRVVSDWSIMKYMTLIPAFVGKKSWKRV